MTLDLHTYESPIGPLLLAARGDQLVALHLPTSADGVPPDGAPKKTKVLAETARQLRAYFAGERMEFDVPLAPEGTPFRRSVWDALCTIPYGETWSYGRLATAVGNPAASRAVGGANHANPIAIIIPCHRVIGASGSLTGYGGGLPTKQFLLALERKRAPQLALL